MLFYLAHKFRNFRVINPKMGVIYKYHLFPDKSTNDCISRVISLENIRNCEGESLLNFFENSHCGFY